MNAWQRINVLLLLVAWTSVVCAAAPDPKYFDDLRCSAGPWGLSIPESLAGLRTLQGKVRETVTAGYTADHERRVLSYDGLRIQLVGRKGHPENFLVERVTIERAQWQLTKWVRVGDSLDAVLSRLGRAVALERSRIEIAGDTDFVSLSVAQNRITRIEFTCYTG